jgi:hypothetical protein
MNAKRTYARYVLLMSTCVPLLTLPAPAQDVVQQAYLKASSPDAEDRFGLAVAASGNTLVVGAFQESSAATGVDGDDTDNGFPWSGAAYVFVRSGTTWSQQAYLKASNTGSGDEFGISVAVSGDTIVVGARYEDSSATGVNGDQADNIAPNAGAAYVFVRSGTTWSQQAYLKASSTDVDDEFGLSVAVSGDTVVVGARGEDSNATGVDGDPSDNSVNGSGATYVFVRSGTIWSQQTYLKASNSEESDGFGGTVSVSGGTVVIGASGEESSATGVNGDQGDNSVSRSGAAYVFVRGGTTWSQQAYLKASNTDVLDQFGGPVSVSGDTVLVGTYWEDSSATVINGDQGDNDATDAGAAYVYVRSGTTWSQQAYLKASNAEARDAFGVSVSVSGDRALVGAWSEDGNALGVDGDSSSNSASRAGAAYVFARSGTSWSEEAYLKASNTSFTDFFGVSVSVSGDTVVVGASGEDSGAAGVDGDQTDNSFSLAGSAYAFDLASADPTSFCDDADRSLAACPCSNPGSPGSGCDIQQGTGGVELSVFSQATFPQNRVTWSGTGFPAASAPTSIVIRAQGLDSAAPVVFGDGLRCIGVPIVRLAATFAGGGSVTHTHGHGTMAGTGPFFYQLWFRNTPIMFCDPMEAFNLSNGRTLTW